MRFQTYFPTINVKICNFANICSYHRMVSQQNVFAFTCADPERDRGSGSPSLINHKIYIFLAILVRIPIKITKLLSQRSMFGNDWPARVTPFNWCFAGVIWHFAGGPMMVRF